MHHSDVVNTIATRTRMEASVVATVLDELATLVQQQVGEGQRIQVSGLFIAETTRRAQRTGRNPRTGEPIDIPAHRAVKLTPAAALRRAGHD